MIPSSSYEGINTHVLSASSRSFILSNFLSIPKNRVAPGYKNLAYTNRSILDLHFEFSRIAAKGKSGAEFTPVEERSFIESEDYVDQENTPTISEPATMEPTGARKGQTAVEKSDDAVSAALETPTLDEADWLMIATTDIANDSDVKKEDLVERELNVIKDELEMIKEVLEATRTAFREELETNLCTKHKLAAVIGELSEVEAANNVIKDEHTATKLQLAVAEEELQVVRAELEAAKDTFKKEREATSHQLIAAGKELDTSHIELEAANTKLGAAMKEIDALKAKHEAEARNEAKERK
jgi:hypothetical protein